MDERDFKAMNREENKPFDSSAVIKSFIYLITNETEGIVESAWHNFESARKECKKREKMKPHQIFMVVELPINSL